MNTALEATVLPTAISDTRSVHRSPWLPVLVAALALCAACATSDTEPSEASSAGAGAGGDGEAAGVEETEQDEANRDGVALTVEIEPNPDPEGPTVVARTNVQASGNRYLSGQLDLAQEPTVTALPFVAVWVLPLADGSVIAVGENGSAVSVASDGDTTSLPSVDPAVAPVAISDDSTITLVPGTDGVDSDLPDANEVQSGRIRAWYDGATDRVPHGALGDTVEATRLVILRRLISDPMDDTGEPLLGQERVVVDLENDPMQSVFEGLAPLLADVDGDGSVDVLTTISNRDNGARLAVFNTDGERIAESAAIGQGNRWRHQIAVAPTGPDGEVEIIEVQTPHIGGLLQFQRMEGDELTLQHQVGEFRSHVLGSRNLDGAVVFDADGDGQPEVVVPMQDLGSIAIVGSVPTDDGPEPIDLGGATVTSNLGLVGTTDAGLVFTFAASDGTLMVWGG